MTARLHSCGYVHDCEAPDPAQQLVDPRSVATLVSLSLTPDEARETVLGWYDDEDRMGYEQGHECCPDCGCDPEDHTCHAEGCRRIDKPPAIQCGPPWLPFPGEATA